MSKIKTKNNTLYLPKEKLWVNPKVFKLLSPDIIRGEIPEETELPEFRAVYGELTKLSTQDPVSNTEWDFIRFLDSSIFSPASNAFKKSEKSVAGTNIKPSYTHHIPGTIAHKKFWKEELRRIIHGYEPLVDGEPCGLRISGEFYFYLNYCRISVTKKDSKGRTFTEETFPQVLSMDYYFFKEVDSRERPYLYNLSETHKKVGIAVAKSRRKGFSFKAASGAVWITAFPKKKNGKPKVLIASDTGSDAVLCFKKAMTIIDWLTEYTPFGRQDVENVEGWKHIQASMTADSGRFTFGLENTKTKQRIGRLSEIQTVTLKTRADKAAGEGADRVYVEEAGKTEKLLEAWEFTRPVLKPGSLIKGLAIIFGTGGEMVKKDGSEGHSRGFSKLFNKPLAADLAAYDNIYEYNNTQNKCGWFVSDMWANFGAYIEINGTRYESIDENGNAYFWVAELYLNKERLIKKKNASKDKYNKFLTQRCKTPSEAFLVTEGNVFPAPDLFARDTDIKMGRLGYKGLRTKGELIESSGRVSFRPDLENKLEPIDTYVIDSLNKEGCLLRYEAPMKINGVIPEGAYIISVDPIGQNTVSGKSLTSIIVAKTPKYLNDLGTEKIVATYRGRSKNNPQGYVHELLLKLSKYYNAKITFENDRDGGILQYFIRKGELARLMSKPEMTLSKYMPTSKTLLREYGHSMATKRHKRIGEDLLLEWLLKRHPSKKVVDSSGNIIKLPALRNLDMLEDRALIEELQLYERKGNYDTVMAMMGIVVQINELYNEDFLENDFQQDTVSDFWNGLYVKNYGTEREKYNRLKEKNNNKNKEINWEYDNI